MSEDVKIDYQERHNVGIHCIKVGFPEPSIIMNTEHYKEAPVYCGRDLSNDNKGIISYHKNTEYALSAINAKHKNSRVMRACPECKKAIIKLFEIDQENELYIQEFEGRWSIKK